VGVQKALEYTLRDFNCSIYLSSQKQAGDGAQMDLDMVLMCTSTNGM
jgi:hypothetical protein